MRCILVKSIIYDGLWLRLIKGQLHIISCLFRVKVFLYPSFHVYGLIWRSFSGRLSSTFHVPWRAPINMYFKWWTCTNKPCSVLSKASWSNHGVEREREQLPFFRSFCMEDLVWTDHMTNVKEKYKTFMLAIIFWAWLEDFIKGGQHHPHYPCKYTKEILRINLPNFLRSPCAHSLVV